MKLVMIAVLGLALGLAAVFVVAGNRTDSGNATLEAQPHFQDVMDRRIAFTDEAVVSRGQDPMYVQLVEGTIPPGTSQLVVMTDENCTPDAQGVSHCLNRVRYQTPEGYGEAVLQHHRCMSEESCLAPGEMVSITA